VESVEKGVILGEEITPIWEKKGVAWGVGRKGGGVSRKYGRNNHSK
jgi:hypothetical protein